MPELSDPVSETKIKLLHTADRLWEDPFVMEVSLSGIAAEAGVTPALVNYYFGNKEGLEHAMLEHRWKCCFEESLMVFEKHREQNPALQLRELTSLLVRSVFPLYYLGKIKSFHPEQVFWYHIQERMSALFSRIVIGGVSAGLFERAPLGLDMTRMIFGMVRMAAEYPERSSMSDIASEIEPKQQMEDIRAKVLVSVFLFVGFRN